MMWWQVDISNGNLTSPSQEDDDLLEFHWVSGCAGWYRVLDALADEDHQTTALVKSCVIAPTQSQSQGFVGCGLPGRASCPGSMPHQFCGGPRCLQARQI